MSTIQQFAGDKILLTATGNLIAPVFAQACSRRVLIPNNLTSGVQATVQPVNDIGLNALSISEGNSALSNISSLSFDNLGFVLASVTMDGMSQLVVLNLPALNSVGGLALGASSGLAKLTTLNIPLLGVIAGSLQATLPLLSAFSAPALVDVLNTFNLSAAAMTSFSAPSLVLVNNALTLSGAVLAAVNLNALTLVNGTLTITAAALTTLALPALVNGTLTITAAALTSLTLPALTNNGLASPSFTLNCPALPSFSAPLLQNALGGFSFLACTAMTTLSLPALSKFGALLFTASTGLVNVTMNQTPLACTGNITMTGQALSVTSVNNILTAMAYLTGSNGTTIYKGTINLSGGTSATPTGAGLTAKNALVAQGATVTTN